MVQSLYDYVSDIGYCRNFFRELVGTNARDRHQAIVSNQLLRMGFQSKDGFYVSDNCGEVTDCPILVRQSKRNSVREIDDYAKTHLVSSVIKNVFMDDTITDNTLKGSAAVYIYYYHALYGAVNKITNPDDLTNAVVLTISETIKTMCDKELTLYRNCDEIPDYREVLRTRLNMERTVGQVRKLNLRA